MFNTGTFAQIGSEILLSDNPDEALAADALAVATHRCVYICPPV